MRRSSGAPTPVLIGLGIGLLFSMLDRDTAWYSPVLGAHLTWTLPFGLLIRFTVFNRSRLH